MAAVLMRRELLGAGVFCAGLVGASRFRSGSAADEEAVLVVSQPRVEESERFAASLISSSQKSLALDVGSGLDELLGDWPRGARVIAGLTSDPAAMIAAQLLIESGAEPLLRWEHSYEAGRWTHRIGAAPGLGALPQYTWPAVVAQKVRDELDGHKSSPRRAACISGECALASNSPGLLVTWAFRLAGETR